MLALADFNTITFDCYGTLIDWERGILDELRPWLARNGRQQLSDDAILEAFAPYEAACEAETPAAPYPAILEEVHGRLARHWKVAADAGAAKAFGQSVGKWPAFPDTPEALKYLKRHYKLVIISNVDRASFAVTNKKLGVEFDRIITAQDVGSYKPNPRNFEYALTALQQSFGTRKSDVLHAACSIFHDILPAKSLGLGTVWIDRRRGGSFGLSPNAAGKGTASQPDLTFTSMAEFAAFHEKQPRAKG
jgi:2-haloacid dehalogenase